MSSAPSIEPFEGTGTWEECDGFTRAIRAAAWKEGKIWDNSWMAGFASLHFSRKARLWHSQLPEDVRQDWSKLEPSIITRWAPSDDDNRVNIQPTPAAAPSKPHSGQADLPHHVILKVVDESNTERYVGLPDNANKFKLTGAAKDACRVRCSSLSSFMVLEPVGYSRHSWIAVHWCTEDPTTDKGCTEYAFLTTLYSSNLKSSAPYKGPAQPMRCTVSANGELTALWEKEDGSKITLFPILYISLILLVADPEAYCKANPEEERVKLFIEPIDQA